MSLGETAQVKYTPEFDEAPTWEDGERYMVGLGVGKEVSIARKISNSHVCSPIYLPFFPFFGCSDTSVSRVSLPVSAYLYLRMYAKYITRSCSVPGILCFVG